MGKLPGGGEMGIEMRGVAVGGETGGVFSPAGALVPSEARAPQSGHADAPTWSTLPQLEQFTTRPRPS